MKKIAKNNIYAKIPSNIPKELTAILSKTKNIKIEKIISKGHITEQNKWYNQSKNEFVLILQGAGKILFEDKKIITLKKGDYIIIPKKTKHKVVYTSKNPKTIWLAVFYE